ncbi:MAG: hemerythrin domain-containing protein [Pseudomonadota bacterium]|nr:hemerythrin domain-containing protein [Pseudomonadota bacterium]
MVLKRDHQTVNGLFRDFERLADDDTLVQRQLVDRIRQELDVHLRVEEELFYPELERVPEAADLVAEARAEHQLVKDLCAEIARLHPTDIDYAAKIEVLRENFDHHVEEEESEIFPLAKKHISGDRLEKIGDQLENRREEILKQIRKTEMA